MTGMQLHPIDTWFFRDGTPFTANDAAQEGVASLFPPSPLTIVGAVRAALAASKGWDGRSGWSREICAVLGDGPDDLGALSVNGPFLLRDGQPLFRLPRHVLGSSSDGVWQARAFLWPGRPVTCDLGADVRLPVCADANLKPGEGVWLTQAGFNAVLRGDLPDASDVVPGSDLWSPESRIGLQRDACKRTAKEGMLFSTTHVRLRQQVSLGIRVSGLPPDWPLPFGCLVPLGGESRMAACTAWEWQPDVTLTSVKDTRKFAVVALSPLDLEEGVYSGRRLLDDLGARVVSACLERPQRMGGWNSLAKRPLPLRSVLPPGSVLFCETVEPGRLRDAVAAHDGLTTIGRRREWGFGLVALGAWPDQQEVT